MPFERPETIRPSSELAELTGELHRVNEALWDIEDAIRACERAGDFGPRFVDLARSVYRENDRRASLKRRMLPIRANCSVLYCYSIDRRLFLCPTVLLIARSYFSVVGKLFVLASSAKNFGV